MQQEMNSYHGALDCSAYNAAHLRPYRANTARSLEIATMAAEAIREEREHLDELTTWSIYELKVQQIYSLRGTHRTTLHILQGKLLLHPAVTHWYIESSNIEH